MSVPGVQGTPAGLDGSIARVDGMDGVSPPADSLTGETAGTNRIRSTLLPILATLLIGGLGYFWRFGYQFGFSDQDEFLPWLAARVGAEGLWTDWFVAGQASTYNIRAVFVMLLEGPARLVGVEPAVAIVYAISASAIILAVFGLARALGSSPFKSLIAVLLVLVLFPRWTMGGNSLMAAMLVPSMLAWACGLWALVLVFQRKHVAAGLLVGAAGWIHILIGAQVGAIVVAGLLVQARGVSSGLARFSLVSLSVVLPNVLMLAASSTGLPSGSYETLALVRAPHHYLPDHFPTRDYLQFGALVLIGLAATRYSGRNRSREAQLLAVGLLSGTGLLLLAGAGAWLVGWRFGVSLQLFMASVTSAALLLCLLASALPNVAVPDRVWGPACLLAILGWSLVLGGVRLLDKPPRADARWETVVAEWAGQHSDPGARFALPPSSSGFRYAALRPIVVNFKAYPFSTNGVTEWRARIDEWAPGILGSVPDILPGGTSLLAPLDAAYESLSPTRLLQLSAKHDVAFVVRRTALPDWAGPPPDRIAGHHVYSMLRTEPRPERGRTSPR